MRIVVPEPAAELARQRCSESLPGFAMAYSILVADLAIHPEKGRFSPGSRLDYTMAMRKKPRIRVIYRYERDTLVNCQLDADPPMGEPYNGALACVAVGSERKIVHGRAVPFGARTAPG